MLMLIQETMQFVEKQHEWLINLQSMFVEKEQKYRTFYNKLDYLLKQEKKKPDALNDEVASDSTLNANDSSEEEKFLIQEENCTSLYRKENKIAIIKTENRSADYLYEIITVSELKNNDDASACETEVNNEINETNIQQHDNICDEKESLTKPECNIIEIKEESNTANSSIIDNHLEADNETRQSYNNTNSKTDEDVHKHNTAYVNKNQMYRKTSLKNCKYCKKTFNASDKLRRHLQNVHNIKAFGCTFCEKRFVGKSNLKRHMRTHTGEKPFNCDYCDKKFALKHYMFSHIQYKHKSKSTRPFGCNECKERFVSKYRLNEHMLTHTGEKPLKCEYCDKRFVKKYNLNEHMRTHTGEKTFKCEYCDKSFAKKQTMLSHIQCKHESKSTRPFGCSECEKRFVRKYALNVHMLTHTGENLFKCEYCNTSFAHKRTMLCHIQYKHESNITRPFGCNYCEKRFSTKTNLNVHMHTHTGEKPFKCDYCDKKFALKHHMVSHIKYKHASKSTRPFGCNECKMRFVIKSALNAHMLKHTS